MNLDTERIVGYRQWGNKLWNAARFALMNLGEGFQPPAGPPSPAGLPFACQWILSRLNAATDAAVKGFSKFKFAAAEQVSRMLRCRRLALLASADTRLCPAMSTHAPIVS